LRCSGEATKEAKAGFGGNSAANRRIDLQLQFSF
jgi:hypothetical protein